MGDCGGLFLPIIQDCPLEQLEAFLESSVRSGQLPPKGWTRCSYAAKRRALLRALQGAHMHVVFAMQPASHHFRSELQCVKLEEDVLNEAMAALCADAKAENRLPHREAVSWLLEQGASAKALLPACRPNDQLAGLSLLAALGAAAAPAAREVVKCLRDVDARVCQAAAGTLGSIGPEAVVTYPRIVGKVSLCVLDQKFKPNVREAAAKALGCFGQHASEHVRALLLDEDSELRELGALAVGAAGRTEEAAAVAERHVPILISWLVEDSSAATPLHRTAADALGLLGPRAGSSAAAALEARLLCDGDDGVRERAAVALGHLGTAAASHLEGLVACLDDRDAFVREAASSALEKISRARAQTN